MDDKPRILGVDDSLTIRKALEIVLKPAGYDLELAADGAEAIDKAKSLKPALILLDFILPDMRGTEVCRRLAEDADTADIPVVLISAKGAEIRQAYRDAGNVVSYIAKPFKPQVVTSIVAEVLAKVASGELVKSAVPVHEAEGPAAVAGEPLPEASPEVQTDVREAAAPVFAADATHAADNGRVDAARANGHDEIEELDADEAAELERTQPGLSEPARREMLEMMFETLRSGLEGVYVEEVDTPAGAAADQAKSYTDLIERLGHELAETLQHARSRARFSLYGDGSLRSLDETLIDIFRRSCRLLFRAVVAGAVENEAAPNRRRLLVACHRESQVHEQLRSMLSAHPEWQVFTVTEGFRQLPLIARLYGPTHLIVEATGAGALWEQLRTLQRMPEAGAMTVMAIAAGRAGAGNHAGDNDRAAENAERGITRSWASAYDLERDLDETVAPAAALAEPPAFAGVEATI